MLEMIYLVKISNSIIKVTSSETLLTRLKAENNKFMQVKTDLINFLEEKRMTSSIFFFLTSEDLLILMAEGSNIASLNQILPKVLTGVVSVELNKEQQITAING